MSQKQGEQTSAASVIGSSITLAEHQQREDEGISRTVGPKLVNEVVKLLGVAQLFGVAHNQTRQAAQELCDSLAQTFVEAREERLALQLTDANIFLNGQLIKFDEGSYGRSVILRATFLTISINQLTLERGVGAGEWVALVTELKKVKENNKLSLEQFTQPHLKLQAVAHKELDELKSDDDRRDLIEIYAGLVIKCASYFHQLERTPHASARFIKRLIQKASDKFPTHRHVFIGLINLRLIRDQAFVHAVNTAMYAMFIAQELGLDRRDLVKIGMTAITQDIHRVRQRFAEAPADGGAIELGKPSHFQTNMTSVVTLSEMGATDILSALRLVTSYERGFPYNKPLPPEWYSDALRPHLLSRIVEIARHYDLLVQGLDGQKQLTPDMALQALSAQMGSHYDPRLTKLFINLIGIYPVGEVVMLSTGARALVVRSPSLIESQSNKSVAHRPVVRLLDGSERLLDLGAPEHAATRILKIVDRSELEEQPGAFFFF